MQHTLIAGIGNIFLGDDAFGVEVARRLAGRRLPEHVQVVDFGIRGLDLAYALLEERYQRIILVDAAPRGGAPGSLYVIEPTLDPTPDQTPDPAPDPTESAIPAPGAADASVPDPAVPSGPLNGTHNVDPSSVLRLARELGGDLGRVVLVACEPAPPPPDFDPHFDVAPGLSDPVRLAVDAAADLIESMVSPEPVAHDHAAMSHAGKASR